jgi:hypothetical protein
MASVHHPLNLGQAPAALAAWLLAADYSGHARERIVAYVEAHGCLAGCPELDREDEATATEVYVEALPSVPQTDPAWCDGGAEYTLSDPAELERIDAENFAAECDRRDMVDASCRWHAMMAASLPTDAELAQLAAHGAI